MTEETNLPKVVTATNKTDTILTNFQIRDHQIVCDEMPFLGGNDEGPDPFDLLIAGVGGCTAISLRQFAERKGWDIGEIDITLTYDQVDGEDLITKEISFSGDLTDQQRTILLRVASCYTEKKLVQGFKFTNALIDSVNHSG
jgi:putative redox protein